MAGTATGRFTSSAPAFHNFSNRTLDPSTFTLEEEKGLSEEQIADRYNLRKLLLKEPGVFSLDFKAQENRMVAYLTDNPRDAQIFIEGRNIHEEGATRLNTSYNIAKGVNHGITYGMGKILLASHIKVSLEEADALVTEF